MPPVDQISATRREFSLTTGRKISQGVYAAVLFAGAGFFLRLAVDPVGQDFVLAVGGISLVIGLILIVQAWTLRLILDGDRIEVRSAFRSHSASRAEIEGLRKIKNQYGSWTRVYLKQNLGSFSVSDFFADGDNLCEWFKGLPDLDGRDADEITKEISLRESPTHEETGATKAFSVAKAWAIGLSVLAGAASIPVMFVSYAPVYKASLVVLLACPVVGILLLRFSPLFFTLFRRKPDPRADLSFLLLWPGFGVVLSYQFSNDPTHLVDPSRLMYWELAVLVAFLAVLLASIWKNPSRWAVLFFLLITGVMYSIGLVNSADTLPDHSAPRPYETWVLGKSESHTSKGTTYFLRVAPWGPITYADDVDVPMRVYDRTHAGDTVCYGLHPGFLNAPWYTSIRCAGRPVTLNR